MRSREADLTTAVPSGHSSAVTLLCTGMGLPLCPDVCLIKHSYPQRSSQDVTPSNDIVIALYLCVAMAFANGSDMVRCDAGIKIGFSH